VTLRLLLRTGALLVSLAVSSAAVFAFMAVLPGDPARVALGVNASDAAVAAMRTQYGLDRPLLTQYVDWATHLVRFDLGTSYVSKAEIGPQVLDRFQVSLWLVVVSMLIAVLVAVPLGTLAAVRHRSALGVVVTAVSQVGVAIPAFLAGIALVTVFAVMLRWLPANGWTPPSADPAMFVKQLILPALSLGAVQGAVLTRYVRSAVLDVLREDYIRTARAKGLPETRVAVRHVLPNSLLPIVTVVGFALVGIVEGAFFTETLLGIPGIGRLTFDSVVSRDYDVILATTVIVAFLFVVMNLLVEIVYSWIDPRVRLGEAAVV